LVSVVMSVFNGERFLREAVSSILEQSLQQFEFIIIDDGSTDCSAQILDSFQNSDPRVAVYHQENRGLIASLNRGCALARGKYIARMDADDIAVRDRLQLQVDFMDKHREVGVLGGAIEWIDTAGKSLLKCQHPIKDRDIKQALNRGDCPFSHPTVLMQKEVLDSVTGYRMAMVHAEDYDLWLRIADRFQLANLDTVVLKYRVHPNQVSVRRCRQQAISNLAARIAASERRNGNPDPFDSAEDITSKVLIRFGVSEAKQQTAVVRGCISCISSMCEAGEYEIALNEISEVLRSSDLKLVDSPEMADLRLLAARLYWHQSKFAKSILCAGHAVIARPKILGRPLKSLMRRFGLAEPAGETITKV
jgi:glycosyltransferase involved in cell wall biosynthesis